MDQYTATEQAYKNGYEQGKKDATVHGTYEERTICFDDFDGGRMTNPEAAQILERFFVYSRPARANGKSLMMLQWTEALMKAIACLKAHPD